jgi:hypothetical protein
MVRLLRNERELGRCRRCGIRGFMLGIDGEEEVKE